jgi:hypothetical protein
MNYNPRDSLKAYTHVIDFEKDIIYYKEYIEEDGFEGLFDTCNGKYCEGMEIDIDDNHLSFLFTAHIDNPIKNTNFSIFYDVLMDIIKKRSTKSHGVQRGDIIHLNFICDTPQEGYFFWDGSSIIRGDVNEDGKYKIPKQFHIFEEFPPNYWSKFPSSKFNEEMVIITKDLLKSTNIRFYFKDHILFGIYFQSEQYFVFMTKTFAETILDSSESKEFVCHQEEIPNYTIDFLRSQGIESSIIYERTVAVQEFNEDTLCEMLEDVSM